MSDRISEMLKALFFLDNFALPENDASWNGIENSTVKTLELQTEIFPQWNFRAL